MGGGIATTYGNATGADYAITTTVKDTQDLAHSVRWARPQPVNIILTVTVTYDNTGPVPSPQDVLNAILTFGKTYPAGKNVWPSAIAAAIFDGPTTDQPGATPVPGILDVSALLVGTTGGTSNITPSAAMIPIDVLHRAFFDSSNITVSNITLIGAAP